MNINNSQSFKYKIALVGKTSDVNNGNSIVKNTKTVVPLEYLSNFLKITRNAINLELNWIENCILSSVGDSTKFKITDAKLDVPIVTLSTKGNLNLTKQLRDGFKRSVYWNKYQIIPTEVIDNGANIYKLLNASF